MTPLSVTRFGDGPLVVLLHGLGGSSMTWRDQIAPLVDAGFSVLAIDLPGHGESRDVAPTNIIEMAEAVARCLSPTGEPVAIVGHSMGGRVMFQLVASGLAPCWAIVAVAAQAYPPEGPYRGVLQGVRDSTAQGGLEAFRKAFIEAREVPRRVTWDPAYAGHFWARFSQNRADWLVAALDAILSMDDLRPRLPRLSIPLLVIVGEDDPPFREAARQYQALVPGCAVAVVAGSGHDPMVDAPERFNEILTRFLVGAWAAQGSH